MEKNKRNSIRKIELKTQPGCRGRTVLWKKFSPTGRGVCTQGGKSAGSSLGVNDVICKGS